MTLIEFDPDFSDLRFPYEDDSVVAEQPNRAVRSGEATPADELVIPVEIDEAGLYYFNPKRRS